MGPAAQTSGAAMTTEGELDVDLVRDVFGHIEAPEDEESPGEASSQQADELKQEGEAGEASTDEIDSLQAEATPESATDDAATAGADTPQTGGEQTRSQVVESLILEDDQQGNDNLETLARPRRSLPRDTSPQRERDLAYRASRQRRSAEVAPEPLVKTMVEILPKKGAGGDDEAMNLLPEGLDEIFQHKETSDPRVKMLLMELETVDIKELKRDLTDFAKSIGAISDKE